MANIGKEQEKQSKDVATESAYLNPIQQRALEMLKKQALYVSKSKILSGALEVLSILSVDGFDPNTLRPVNWKAQLKKLNLKDELPTHASDLGMPASTQKVENLKEELKRELLAELLTEIKGGTPKETSKDLKLLQSKVTAVYGSPKEYHETKIIDLSKYIDNAHDFPLEIKVTEQAGKWLAEAIELPQLVATGESKNGAVQALVQRVLSLPHKAGVKPRSRKKHKTKAS